MTDFTDADLQLLTTWDTPTICNALEVVVPHRRATGFTVRPMVCLDPSLKPIVGRARTATIRAMDVPGPLRRGAAAEPGSRTTNTSRAGPAPP